MAQRDDGTTRTHGGTTNTSGATTADAMEQRVVAFAEQLGWIAGALQATASRARLADNVQRVVFRR